MSLSLTLLALLFAVLAWVAVHAGAPDRHRRAQMTNEERALDDEDTARWNREW